MFTVADALNLEPFASAEVIAGRNGLNRKVEHVSVMEVDLTEWYSPQLVRGAGLEISSMYALVNYPSRQVEAIRYLNKSGGSGLVLCYVGKVLKVVSQELIDVCNELDFPLIIPHSMVSYKEIIRAISDALLGLDNKALRDAIGIYEYVTKLLINGKGDSSLAAALEHMLGKRVIYFNQAGHPVYTSGYSSKSGPLLDLEQYISQNSSDLLRHPNGVSVNFPKLSDSIYLRPVCSKAFHFGTLAIWGNSFSDLDRVAISQICNAMTITILSHISISQQQEKLRTDFVRDLLSGHCREDDILSRSTALQCDIQHVSGCILLSIHYLETEDPLKESLSTLQSNLYEQVRDQLSSLSPDSICANFNGKVVILYVKSQHNQQNIMQTARSLQRAMQKAGHNYVYIGVGTRCGTYHDIRESFHTAQMALCVAASSLVLHHFADAETIPAYISLLGTCGIKRQQVSDVVAKLLEPIRQYDAARNSELEKTFRSLLQNGMDYGLVAEELFLHKNTVLQRKQKIISLYKDNPFLLPARQQFELAFIMERLYLNSPKNWEL